MLAILIEPCAAMFATPPVLPDVMLDGILRSKVPLAADALHRIRTGVVRGMAASERLFSDIHRALA